MRECGGSLLDGWVCGECVFSPSLVRARWVYMRLESGAHQTDESAVVVWVPPDRAVLSMTVHQSGVTDNWGT